MSELYALGSIVQELTNGRPYIFMVMPFNKHRSLFEKVRNISRDAVGIECIRADMIPGAGHDLLAKIHLLIERAELVVADVTTKSPNVFYEVGYATGTQKQVLLIADKGTEVPTDLKGRESIEYGGSRSAMAVFEQRLREHLRVRISSQRAVLKDMLEGQNPRPMYIVASPKYPGRTSRIRGQVYDERTFGDNLGILGLIAAFGLTMGEAIGIELISAQYQPPSLLDKEANLYLIGSGKVNPLVEKLLLVIQRDTEPNWRFGPLEGFNKKGDWPVGLYGTRAGRETPYLPTTERRGSGRAVVHQCDYGIVIRAPHPKYPDRLVLIMAGAHSLGTGAACLAATRSQHIQRIKAALPTGADIGNKELSFWALVKGETNAHDDLLDVDGVTIVEAGTYGTA